MKLVDRIVSVDAQQAVTESTVRSQWPLIEKAGASPLVVIELVAQTAAIFISWNRKKEAALESDEKGWLVGIKAADFYTNAISIGTEITTRVGTSLNIDNYIKIQGQAFAGPHLIGEIGLQLFWMKSGWENTE
jgi:predicted hotdog family 3-hydroxylacyl-ACP dehydratase